MIRECDTNPALAVEAAAQRLGVEPAVVRYFVRQRFLREASHDPPTVWGADVERLRRVLDRRTSPTPG
jgi:hypothetical protein